MAIPTKRHERNDLSYLTKPEIDALVQAPDRTTWLGRRDHTLLLTMITTGVRVSELIALKINDVTVATGANHLKVHGKGRKNRTTPLKAETTTALRAWLHERAGTPEDPLFPTRQGHQLHRRTVALLVTKHARAAAACCPVLASKRVSPHTLRHTNAMLLQAEHVDIARASPRRLHGPCSARQAQPRGPAPASRWLRTRGGLGIRAKESSAHTSRNARHRTKAGLSLRDWIRRKAAASPRVPPGRQRSSASQRMVGAWYGQRRWKRSAVRCAVSGRSHPRRSVTGRDCLVAYAKGPYRAGRP